MSAMELRDIGIAFDRPRLPLVLTPKAPPDRPHGYQVTRLRGPRRDVPAAARRAGRGVAQAVAPSAGSLVRRRRLLAALVVQLVLDGLQDVGALQLTGH